MDVFNETVTMDFTSVDPSGRITLYGIFDFFQKAATCHAEALGVGRTAMEANGMVWILSRMSVQIERRPKLDETLVLRTWPCGFAKLFTIRDYDMTVAGKRIVRARSLWLLLDIESHRILRPSALQTPLPLNEGLCAMEGLPPSLAEQEFPQAHSERIALYSDIDFNSHVNNTRYVQWIQDITDFDVLSNADCIRFDIHYISEIKYGEKISLYRKPVSTEKSGDTAFVFEGRKADGQAAFRAVLGFGGEALP